jgi:GNAT superfamily N-acetyltransferase
VAEARLAELDARFPTPGVLHLCATVDDLPVGLASFRHQPDRRANSGKSTEEDLEAAEKRRADKEAAKDDRHRGYEQTLDGDFAARFKTALESSRKGWAEGRAYWLLSMLCVHPDHQGRGIARSLLAWGTAQADLRGMPMLLESSAAVRPPRRVLRDRKLTRSFGPSQAQPLYVSAGFEVVTKVAWSASDGTAWSMPVMARAPQPRPASLAKPLPLIPRPAVVLSPVTADDWADVGRIRILSLGSEGKLFNNCYPTDRRLPLAIRVSASPLPWQTLERKSRADLWASVHYVLQPTTSGRSS